MTGPAQSSRGVRGTVVLAVIVGITGALTVGTTWVRRHAGPAHARRLLAQRGVELARIGRESRAYADALAAARAALAAQRAVDPAWGHEAAAAVLARLGEVGPSASGSAAAALPGTASHTDPNSSSSASARPRFAADDNDPWAVLVHDPVSSEPTRVEADLPDAPADRATVRRAIDTAFAALLRLRRSGVDWSLAITAMGFLREDDPAEAGVAPPYALYMRRRWSLEVDRATGLDEMWLVALDDDTAAARHAELALVRAFLRERRAATAGDWPAALPDLERFLRERHERGSPYRYQASPHQPWSVAAAASSDGEQVVVRLRP